MNSGNKIINILDRALENGISVFTEGQTLKLKVKDQKKVDAKFISLIKHHKQEILDYLISENENIRELNTTEDKIIPFDRAAVNEIPLSFAQQRLWFVDKLKGSTNYHIPEVLRFKGELNKGALEKAFRNIVNRHDALRTVFGENEGQPFQQIMPKGEWGLDYTNDLDDRPEATLGALIENEINKPFKLAQDHPFRAHLVRELEQEHVLIIVMHHIASDGWSMPIMVAELIESYQAICEGTEAGLPALPIQYADYAYWQRNVLEGPILDKKLAFWEQKLQATTPLNIPTDFARPSVQSSNGDFVSFMLDKGLNTQLEALAKEEGVTPFMLLLSVFKTLLYRYSGQTDICVGSPIANRQQSEVEALIGFFVNTLALRSELDGNLPFNEFLQQMKATTLEAYSNQEAPFEKIVERVEQTRDMSRTPIFQVMFAMQNNNETPELRLGDLVISSETFGHDTSQFDLNISVEPDENELWFFVEYCTDLFTADTIQKMMEHFQLLLTSVVQDRTQKLDELSMLSLNEKQLLIKDFNENFLDYPKDKSMVDWFVEQAARTPDATAIVFENQKLSYQELDKRSNQLAHYLRKVGGEKENLIAVCMDRSPEMIIGMMGILKAGAAYVPIDPAYPEDRIRYILQDSDTGIILSNKNYKSLLHEKDDAFLILLDEDWWLIDQESGEAVEVERTADSLMYVIYTSGSTGRPKGVMISNKNTQAFLAWCREEYQNSSFETVYAGTSICFDISVFELFYTLTTGKQIRLLGSGLEIANYLKNDQGILINTVPSVVGNLLEEGVDWSNVNVINIAGEPIPAWIKNGLDLNQIEVRNLYGPSEDTTFSTGFRLVDERPVLIGKPINNTQVYIVDANMNLLPQGVVGELCLSGDGVSLGYLNRPELTAEKYIDNPFDKKGSKLYRTGDLARWTPDGNLDCLGRIDTQVKIRGYRIELGEIESIMEESPLVGKAVVLAKANESGVKRLVAYVVNEGGVDKAAIQKFLRSRLPDYMVPDMMIELPELPQTPNGKVDKKALPEVEMDALVSSKFVAARNKMEEQIAAIWMRLLKVEKVGIFHNFFELGGHSLLATRVISAIERELGVTVEITDFFTRPTVESLAAFIATKEQGEAANRITVQERPERIPLSFAQERLWFIDQLDGSSHYHMPMVLELNGAVDKDAVQHAFKEIVNRHESLRTIFREEEGKAYQEVIDASQWSMNYVDWNECANDLLETYIDEQINQPFDLANDYVIRVVLLRQSEEKHILLIVLHHIASDGWSETVLLNEFNTLYKAKLANETAELPALPIQYADYSIWQRINMGPDQLEQKLSYWKQKLANLSPLNLPTDFARPSIQSTEGGMMHLNLDKELRDQLIALSQQKGTTLYMLLLAAFKVLMYRYSGQDDICIGSPIANRTQAEVEALIGFFVNTLAIRSDLSDNPDFDKLLEQVKTNTLEAYAHQDVPFEKVVDAVEKKRDRSRTPLFQVMFTLQNTPEETDEESTDLSIETGDFSYEMSKFDLSVYVMENEEGMKLSVNYCSKLFTTATIDRLMWHFRILLNSIAADSSTAINSLTMLLPAEEQQLLGEFNNTEVEYPADKTIVDLFEEQVQETPNAEAIAFEGEVLTYQELNEKSNQLARHLQAKGVKEESLVAICIDRSINMMVGLMAILKSGGAYVPMDPEYPQDRIDYIIENANASHVICTAAYKGLFEGDADTTIILIDEQWEEISQLSTEAVTANRTPENLMYVIYTSGSTGKPKGVMNQYDGVVNRLIWAQSEYQFEAGVDIVLQKTTFCFDVSVWELFWPLITGVKLVFARPGGHKDSFYLKSLIENERITAMHFVPSMLEVFLLDIESGDCPSLRKVLCSGEALRPSHAKLFSEKLSHVELHNLYGPTEAAIDVTSWQVPFDGEAVDKVLIGKPVSNTQLHILNPAGALCAVGVPGELHIAGIQVARGYLNRPELTAEKFVSDPFNEKENARMYKTGDLARWLADGNIEYLGRIDSQVKIRGNRIELGEIETVMQEVNSVDQCVVVVKEDAKGRKQLVAYVIGNKLYDKSKIQTYLKTKLPEYMVPAIMVEIPEMPLTPNGKINRKALPDPDISSLLKTAYVAPRNEVEQDLANIWTSLLSVAQVGIHDNYFELGGDSIVTIQVVSQAARLGYKLKAKDLFEHQTVAELAGVISSQDELISAEQGLLSGECDMLPIQKRFFDQEFNHLSHYNQAILLRVSKEVAVADLEKAVKVLVDQHDALRFSYHQEDGGWKQLFGGMEGHLFREDLSNVPAEKMSAAITECCDMSQRDLEIMKGDLMRALWIKTPETDTHNRLFFAIHHLAIDGVSWRIILGQLGEILEQISSGVEEVDLGKKSTSYRQWVDALKNYAFSEQLQSQLPYWKNATAKYQPLPTNKKGNLVLMQSVQTVAVQLDETATKALLKEVNQAYQTEINDILLAALAMTIYNWSGQDQIVVGVEGHGREYIADDLDISNTVGWFTSLYPLALQASTSNSIDKLIRSVKEDIRAIPGKGLGYGILRYLHPSEEIRQSLEGGDWDIIFNYLGQFDNVLESDSWMEGAEESVGASIAGKCPFTCKLEINSSITEDQLNLSWNYSTEQYDESRIAELANEYIENLRKIISHCQENHDGGLTPSDYGLNGKVSVEELDDLFAMEEADADGDEILKF